MFEKQELNKSGQNHVVIIYFLLGNLYILDSFPDILPKSSTFLVYYALGYEIIPD